MSLWWFDPGDATARRGFGSLDQVFALSGEQITRDTISEVLRVEDGGRRYYVKRYAGNGKTARKRWFGLRQWLAPQRVVGEWKNLLRFADWGIPTARVVAYGIERRFGGFRRGALVTEEIRDTSDLAKLATRNDPRLRDPHWLARVSGQIARIARRLHNAGFAHNDLYWRNLLVNEGINPEVFLIDCPSGRFWWGPFLQYRILKDLACLDKLARRHLSRTRRLRFYLDYVGAAKLTAADKPRLRRIVRFFEGRE